MTATGRRRRQRSRVDADDRRAAVRASKATRSRGDDLRHPTSRHDPISIVPGRKSNQTRPGSVGPICEYPPPTGPGNQCQDREGAPVWTAWSRGNALRGPVRIASGGTDRLPWRRRKYRGRFHRQQLKERQIRFGLSIRRKLAVKQTAGGVRHRTLEA